MDDGPRERPDPGAGRAGAPRPVPLLLVTALAVVAALTLTPEGTGWSWGAPAEELHWYASGLDSPATVRQLVGNLGLLAVPAALAVVRWPSLRQPARLVALAAASGTGIELLQWALPLGRVVSPLDAVLNAVGAVVAGLLVAAAQPDSAIRLIAARVTGMPSCACRVRSAISSPARSPKRSAKNARPAGRNSQCSVSSVASPAGTIV